MSLDWKPSRGEQRLLWWLKVLLRYVIGGGGVVYSLAVAKDPLGVLVFGAIATSMDMGSFVLTLFRAAQEETRAIEQEIEEKLGQSNSEEEAP